MTEDCPLLATSAAMWVTRRLIATIKEHKVQPELNILRGLTMKSPAMKSQNTRFQQAVRCPYTISAAAVDVCLPGKSKVHMPLERVPRTPRNRAPFSPDQMRARARELQDAKGNANRGPQGEEQGPSRRPFQLPRPPAPHIRRTSDLDIVAQLGAMPAKLTLGTLLQEAPRCRLDLQRFLALVKKKAHQAQGQGKQGQHCKLKTPLDRCQWRQHLSQR